METQLKREYFYIDAKISGLNETILCGKDISSVRRILAKLNDDAIPIDKTIIQSIYYLDRDGDKVKYVVRPTILGSYMIVPSGYYGR